MVEVEEELHLVFEQDIHVSHILYLIPIFSVSAESAATEKTYSHAIYIDLQIAQSDVGANFFFSSPGQAY